MTFLELREIMIAQATKDTKRRIKKNPVPTDIELRIGAFVEMLEPQVREAVITMNQKGYSTESSGFAGAKGNLQVIDGYYRLDPATKEQLENQGVEMKYGHIHDQVDSDKNYTAIQFHPSKPDAELIRKKWNEIVKLLPQKDNSNVVAYSGGAENFRKKYAPDRTDIELLALEKRIALGEDEYEKATWQEMQARLEELKEILASK